MAGLPDFGECNVKYCARQERGTDSLLGIFCFFFHYLTAHILVCWGSISSFQALSLSNDWTKTPHTTDTALKQEL